MTSSTALSEQVDLVVLTRALVFAADKHRNQRRKDRDASPYINHPLDLVNILVEAGIRDAAALAGAALHDTVEDTETTFAELEDKFGLEIANIVREVTDDKDLPKEERKRLQVVHASEISHRSRLVKVADKTANLRDIVHFPPVDWTLTRRQKYFGWAREVVTAVGPVNPALLEAFDQAYKLRPTSR